MKQRCPVALLNSVWSLPVSMHRFRQCTPKEVHRIRRNYEGKAMKMIRGNVTCQEVLMEMTVLSLGKREAGER